VSNTQRITVRLIKRSKPSLELLEITYEADLLLRGHSHILLLARWQRPLRDLGYVTFAPGDYLYEHFYADRWYNVYELHAEDGTLKGWYCNITYPAVFSDTMIESEDLELDIFVSPDRARILVLDEDEYATRNLETSDPPAHRAALAALEELKTLAARGTAPFHPGGLL
jgi:hypothetical protein